MILGAGETSELTARALAEQGAGTIFVANRHADRALSLAQRFGGSVVGLDELPEQLLRADIVLSSTSSPHPIVGRDELELVMRERAERPLLLIDIAVPRDIDPACGELEGVSLYDIDDLQAVVARNLSHARRARRRARRRSSRRRSTASRAGSASSTRCRPSARCASTATRSSSRCSPRTPGAGSRPRRATWRASRRSRARS